MGKQEGIGDVFEALLAGQSRKQVVDDMVARGWSRDEATEIVRKLEDRVSEFLEAGREREVAPEPEPEEPMKSFRLTVGNPTKDAAQIATAIAQAIAGLGLTALVLYSCNNM